MTLVTGHVLSFCLHCIYSGEVTQLFSLMTTKSIPLQVPDYSQLISSPISIYQFREVPLGPHVHNNLSQLEEHNMSMKCTETIVVPVEQETCPIGELATGKDNYITTVLSLNCELVMSVVKYDY